MDNVIQTITAAMKEEQLRKPHSRNQHRAGSPCPATHSELIKKIAKKKTIGKQCRRTDIGFIGRWKKNSHGEGQLEAGPDPNAIKAHGNGREDIRVQSWGSGRQC
jgi:hypothetical protein